MDQEMIIENREYQDAITAIDQLLSNFDGLNMQQKQANIDKVLKANNAGLFADAELDDFFNNQFINAHIDSLGANNAIRREFIRQQQQRVQQQQQLPQVQQQQQPPQQMQQELPAQQQQRPQVQQQQRPQQVNAYTLEQFQAINSYNDINNNFTALQTSLRNNTISLVQLATKVTTLYLQLTNPNQQPILENDLPNGLIQQLRGYDLATTSIGQYIATIITYAILQFKSATPLTLDEYRQFITQRMNILQQTQIDEYNRIRALPYLNLLVGKYGLLEQQQQSDKISAYRFNQLIIKNMNDIVLDRPTLLAQQIVKRNKKVNKLRQAMIDVPAGDRIVIIDNQLEAIKTQKYGYLILDLTNQNIYYPGKKFIKAHLLPQMTAQNKNQYKDAITKFMEMAAYNQALKYEKNMNTPIAKRARKYDKKYQNSARYSDVVKAFFRPKKVMVNGQPRLQYTTIPANTTFEQLGNTAQDLKSKAILNNAARVRQYRLDAIAQAGRNVGGTDKQLQNFLKYQTTNINNDLQPVQYIPLNNQNLTQQQQQDINRYKQR